MQNCMNALDRHRTAKELVERTRRIRAHPTTVFAAEKSGQSQIPGLAVCETGMLITTGHQWSSDASKEMGCKVALQVISGAQRNDWGIWESHSGETHR